jgi:hypothetical protein
MNGKSYSKVLDRELVRHNLTVAGLYLAAYELLMGSIVSQLRSFFVGAGFGVGTAEYASDVLARHKEVLTASCLWLKDMKALTDDDLDSIERIRKHRNEIAHELATFVVDAGRDVNISDFPKIRDLMRKIDTWWILEFHVTTNPDFDGQTIRPEDVASGPMLLLDHLVATVSELHGGPKA